MIKRSCIVGDTQEVCDTVIAYTIVGDTLQGCLCDIGIDESGCLILYEFSFAFENVFERFLVACMLIVVKGAGEFDDRFPGGTLTWALVSRA